jgi:hypothetical protein
MQTMTESTAIPFEAFSNFQRVPVPTPHTDRLAAEGTVFTNAFTTGGNRQRALLVQSASGSGYGCPHTKHWQRRVWEDTYYVGTFGENDLKVLGGGPSGG